ncbi:MAG: uncharacterized protein KVP18_002735 [Porospora cf. gigantea A]|uniref:uncharacterized protein n=1 Tax=Porospora cf. gigantea A TaxID=2853593 RepID=UPI00355AB330|nr:MAG: hypothetical protein KVP18_002735 [Porospora cf. gigantea A]
MLVRPEVVIQFAGLLEPNSLTCIETADFVLHAYETPTGVRFFATASLGEVKVGEFLRAASSVYSDLILKVKQRHYMTQNPFFEEDMPIRSPEFDKALQETCSRIIMK